MTELIKNVKAAKKLLNDSQKDLLKWCQDKNSDTLDKRFEVWEAYVDKHHQSWVGCKGSKILEDLIDYWIDGKDIDRHQTVSYDWFMESILDRFSNEKYKKGILDVLNKHKQLIRDAKIDTILNPITESTKLSNSTGSPSTIEAKTWLGLAIPSEIEFESLLKEEILISNFGSFEFDW